MEARKSGLGASFLMAWGNSFHLGIHHADRIDHVFLDQILLEDNVDALGGSPESFTRTTLPIKKVRF